MTNSTKRHLIDAFIAVSGIALLFAATMGDASADGHEENESTATHQSEEQFNSAAQPTFRLNQEKRWVAPHEVAASLAKVKEGIANSGYTAELGRTVQTEASKLARANTPPEITGMVKEIARHLAEGGSGLQKQASPKQQRAAQARINAAIALFDAFFVEADTGNQRQL